MEYAEDGEDEVTIEYEQRENSSSVSWLDLGDAVVDDVQECFADEAGAGFSWLRVGNNLSGDVRCPSGGTPEACLTDRHEVSSCGPCVPGAQKSWVSLARVLGQLDTRLDVPRTILVMRLFSRGTPTQFVKQTRQLCVSARVGWLLQGWSVWRRPLRQ